MKIMYVSGKYSGKNKKEISKNILKAEKVSIELLKRGWCVITPHKNYSHYEKYETKENGLNYDFWIKCDLELLKKSDAIFMMKDWQESRGAVKEYEEAIKLNLKIYYELADGIPEVKGYKKGFSFYTFYSY